MFWVFQVDPRAIVTMVLLMRRLFSLNPKSILPVCLFLQYGRWTHPRAKYKKAVLQEAGVKAFHMQRLSLRFQKFTLNFLTETCKTMRFLLALPHQLIWIKVHFTDAAITMQPMLWCRNERVQKRQNGLMKICSSISLLRTLYLP